MCLAQLDRRGQMGLHGKWEQDIQDIQNEGNSKDVVFSTEIK